MIAAGAIVHAAGAERPPRDAGEKVPAGPGRTNLLAWRDPRQLHAAAAAEGVKRRLSAHDPRTEMDIAVVGVGVSLTLKDGVCTTARVGLGAVAPTVLLVEAAAKALIGSKLDDAALNAAASACSAACRPIDDKRGTIAYRTKVAGVLLKRTLPSPPGAPPEGIKDNDKTACFHHHQRRAGGISVRSRTTPCSMLCAAARPDRLERKAVRPAIAVPAASC